LTNPIHPSNRAGALPRAWTTIDAAHMLAAVQQFDAALCGYVDWREIVCTLLAAAHPAAHTAEPAVVARTARALAAADGSGIGWLSAEEWEGVQLWFTEATPAEVDAADNAAAAASGDAVNNPSLVQQSALAPALKQLLWTVFAASPQPPSQPSQQQQQQQQSRVDVEQPPAQQQLPWESALLYLCCDRDLSRGVQKAVAAVTKSGAPSSAASIDQVARLCWPLLGPEAAAPLQGAPLTAAQVAAAVRAAVAAGAQPESAAGAPLATTAGRVSDGAAAAAVAAAAAATADVSIRAQQLMTSAACERVVRLLLRRYRLVDVYVSARL